MRIMLIVAEHFYLKRSVTDVIYKIPCYHNSNLQLGMMKRTGLERLMEVVTGGMFKPFKVKMSQQPILVTAWRNSSVQELWS